MTTHQLIDDLLRDGYSVNLKPRDDGCSFTVARVRHPNGRVAVNIASDWPNALLNAATDARLLSENADARE